jgi:aldose 1-epimerase
MLAKATELTPIMLSGHHYWNLEAYQETQDLVGHHAQLDASRFIATDGHLIPTGQLTPVAGTAMDFRKAKSIGGSINATAEAQFCGTGMSNGKYMKGWLTNFAQRLRWV